MQEQTLDAGQAEVVAESFEDRQSARRAFLWTLPQPVLVLGAMFAIATAYSMHWMDADLLTSLLIVLPLPLILIAERIWTKRKDWIPEPKELAEDTLWLAAGAFIWVPLYDDYYSTPISEAFNWIRDSSALPFSMQPESALGLVLCAILARTVSEFIYYWLHRVQHESLFWWRIHATHHHITKMSAARSDRTHPFEWATLMLGTPIVLALFGASDALVAVTGAFGFFNGWLNHSNLPLRSGIYGLYFSTAEMHHLHHSHKMEDSNTNYGCTIIIWDRLFGTYSGNTEIKSIGAGTGKPLSIYTQLTLAFTSKEKLTSL
jgi:sterol desaturase/sphingolipid hydroxylase (fatty acid hydroxylase superfamily)